MIPGERLERKGTYACLRLTRVDAGQAPTQRCDAPSVKVELKKSSGILDLKTIIPRTAFMKFLPFFQIKV